MPNSKDKSKKRRVVSEGPLSQKEFRALIKEAEKGPFYSHMELTDKFDAWKKH